MEGDRIPLNTAATSRAAALTQRLEENMRSEGLEPPTYKFVACCSIQLSYDRMRYQRFTPSSKAQRRSDIPLPSGRFLPFGIGFGERGIRTLDTV